MHSAISTVLLIVFGTLRTNSLHCSRLVTHHYNTNHDIDTVMTRLSVSMTPGTSLCLSSPAGEVTMALTVLETRVLYHVSASYNFTWPEVAVSCYCTCSPSQCKLPTCPLCYNVAHVSPPCPEAASHSSTCCSVTVTTPHPSLTALLLGQSSLQVRYKLETFSAHNTSSSLSMERTVHVGSQGTTVKHNLEDGEMLIHIGKDQGDTDLENVWLVSSPDGTLSVARVNDVRGHNPSLPGWFRTHNGQVLPQSQRLILSNVHVTTTDCEQQQFVADLSSLFIGSGVEDNNVMRTLKWNGQTVENIRSNPVAVNLNIQAKEPLQMFSNKSSLGTWSADIVIRGSESILNITTHRSSGLILGNIENIAFSFIIPSPAPVSFITTSLPSVLPDLHAVSSVRVCLREVSMAVDSCHHAPVAHHPVVTNPGHLDQEADIHVREIPVLWHHEKSAQVNGQNHHRRSALQIFDWLQAIFTTSDPILIFINCSLIFLLLTLAIRIFTCLAPKCNK